MISSPGCLCLTGGAAGEMSTRFWITSRPGTLRSWRCRSVRLRPGTCGVDTSTSMGLRSARMRLVRVDHHGACATAAGAEGSDMSDETPTVVLVHGAFADASSWNGVVELLQSKGVTVTAPANPLRGIALDSEYVAGVLDEIPGPILAVGHSYGGAVLTNAATNADNVVGLVYVAAFAPDEGEVLGEVTGGSKDSVLDTALVPMHYSSSDGVSAVEFAIDPAKFRDAFAADLPAEQTAVMAATQRPVAEAAFSEPSGPPAWKRLPSWAAVASADTAAGTDVILSMAKSAGATITELEGSHVIMISQPEAVTEVIL